MARRVDIETKTEELVLPIIEANNFELVDGEYVKEGANWYLRVYADKEGGIAIDDCVLISRSLEEKLDAEDFIEDAYILEVSSPGLGRPLKKEKDYIRSVGKSIDIKLYKAIDKQKEFTGILKENMEDQIVLTIEDQDITFEKNGIVTASYTTSPVDMNEIMEVANSGKTDAEFKSLINKRTYESSPKGLAYWNQTGNKAFVVQLNIPAIVSLIAQNNGKQIDYQLIAGISEALLKSDPARLKLTLSAINMILNNEIITYILQLDDDTFATLLTWMKDGIPMGINSTKEHTYIYFNKETLMPFISIIGSLLETNLIEVAALFDKMEIGIDLTAKK